VIRRRFGDDRLYVTLLGNDDWWRCDYRLVDVTNRSIEESSANIWHEQPALAVCDAVHDALDSHWYSHRCAVCHAVLESQIVNVDGVWRRVVEPCHTTGLAVVHDHSMYQTGVYSR
jgi:hypothetical protein